MEIFSHKKITVETTFSDKLEWKMNPTLAETLVSNLLKNAFVHNYEGGHIHIYCTTHQFIVSNSGSKEELDKNKIFERFYSTKTNGSSGLGLAIVRAICEISHLNVNYHFEERTHKFIITDKKKPAK
jgi:signal transduction histidine kinase